MDSLRIHPTPPVETLPAPAPDRPIRPTIYGASETLFLEQLSLDLYDKPLSAIDSRRWNAQLSSGSSRSTVVVCWLYSAAFRATYLRELWKEFYGAEPQPIHLHPWLQGAMKDQTDQEVAISMVSRRLRWSEISNHDFVRLLFRVTMDRAASPNELEGWAGLLSSGAAAPEALARYFLFSEEYLRKVVRRTFGRFLRRAPTVDEETSAIRMMRENRSHYPMFTAVLSSAEYFSTAERLMQTRSHIASLAPESL